MRKQLTIVALILAALLAACSKTETPAPAPAPKAEPAPAPPPKETVTFKSAHKFVGPESRYTTQYLYIYGTRGISATVEKEKVTSVQYFVFADETKPIKWMKVPASVSGTVDLDSSGFETFPAEGWVPSNAPKVKVFAFRSDLEAAGNKAVLGNSEGAVQKTIAELNSLPYPVKVVHEGDGTLRAMANDEAMLGEMKPEGVKTYLGYAVGADVNVTYLDEVKKGGTDASNAAVHAVGDYSKYAEVFDVLPDAAKGAIIELVVPVAIRQAIAKSDVATVQAAAKKYLLDVSWDQVRAINPANSDDCSWWPSDIKDEKFVPHYGMNKVQCTELVRVLKLWARRGQFAFERTKSAVARELRVPSAPSPVPAAKPASAAKPAGEAPAPQAPPAPARRGRLGKE